MSITATEQFAHRILKVLLAAVTCLSLMACLWVSPASAADTALHTYGVPLLGSQAEQRIQINPPALELGVITQPAGALLRCGDNYKTYTCKAGQTTLISAEEPISEFWVQHTTEENVNLQVMVYRYAEDPTLNGG